MKKTNKIKPFVRVGPLPSPVQKESQPGAWAGWPTPLCCVGSCMENSVWKIGTLPYCDKHLPARDRVPGTQWELQFKPVGQARNVPNPQLLEALAQGFASGATECLVRRTG